MSEKNTKPPVRIFLQFYGDQNPSGEDVFTPEVTWSIEQVFSHDVEYILASEAKVLRRELEMQQKEMIDACIGNPIEWIIEQARQELESKATK